MNYTAKSHRAFLLLQVVLVIIFLTTGWAHLWIWILGLPLLIFLSLSIFINYSFKIKEGNLTYNVYLFNKSVYQKEVVKSNIKKVTFKRVGWKTKSAVIKLERGFPIRVSLFTSITIFEDLLVFCEENTIQVKKTKDYLRLEKMT